MRVQTTIAPIVMALAFSMAVSGQEKTEKTVRHVPMKPTSPASGKEMFANYWASCHGAEDRRTRRCPRTSFAMQGIDTQIGK